ncbi:response regulator [Nitrospinae bacterium AH-259-F20]|nr:response regulator [Nitrospinae bacterium AH-259-F20]
MLILLDLKLPKVDGLEVLQQIKENPDLRLIPIVVLTTSNQEKDVQRSYELGVNSYVNKPVIIEDLQAKVGNLGLYWVITNEPPPCKKVTPEDSLPLGGNG